MAREKDAGLVKRHLVIRQALIYGVLISGLVVAGVASWGMFTGRLTPWIDQDFSAKPSPTLNEGPQPCPLSATSVYPEPRTVEVIVLNASDRAGAAGAGARVLEELGFVTSAANASTGLYKGGIKLVAGLAGVDNAYAVLKVLPPSAVLTMDGREEATVDVVLGEQADSFLAPSEVEYTANEPIVPIQACKPAEEVASGLDTPAATTESPTPEA